jgi:tetratricopeptide (TPR) repeat protein
MEYTMKPKSLLFLVFSLSIFLSAKAQTPAATVETAAKLEQNGHYKEALQKYERVLYFKPDSQKVWLYIHIGNCYTGLGDYYKGINSYDNALLADVNKANHNAILIQRLKAEISAHNMRFAWNTLKEIDTANDTSRRQVIFYTGVIHFYKEEYTEAEENWIMLAGEDSAKKNTIRMLFKKNAKVNRLKPGVANVLSVILPGAGQIYAGDIKEGLNSLLLNGAIFILGYNTAAAYNLYNAIVAVGPFYLRYYLGGIHRAGDIVMAKRAQKHQQIYSQLLQVLQK